MLAPNILTFGLPTRSGPRTIACARSDLEPVARGGVSEVFRYTVDRQRIAIKLFNDPARVPWDKLVILQQQGGDVPFEDRVSRGDFTIAWPISIVAQGDVRIGLSMPFFDSREWLPLDHWIEFHLAARLKDYNDSLSSRLFILRNVASALTDVHARDMAVIDLKPSNILVHERSCHACMIDVDSYRVIAADDLHPATHVSAGYILPSAYGRDINIGALDEAQDRYAFAVMVFQVLNYGIHPFQGIMATAADDLSTNDQKAARYLYAYARTPSRVIAPLPQSVHTCWPERLNQMLEAAFTAGGTAPAAREWADYFATLLRDKQLAPCPDHPTDARHIRFQSLSCPVCTRARAVADIRRRQSQPAPGSVPPAQRQMQPTKAAAGAVQGKQKSERTFAIGASVAVVCFVTLMMYLNNYPPEIETAPAPGSARVMASRVEGWSAPVSSARVVGQFSAGTLLRVRRVRRAGWGWNYYRVEGTDRAGKHVQAYVRADLLDGPDLAMQPTEICAKALNVGDRWRPIPYFSVASIDSVGSLDGSDDGSALGHVKSGSVFMIFRSIRASTGWVWLVVHLGDQERAIRADQLIPATGPHREPGNVLACTR